MKRSRYLISSISLLLCMSLFAACGGSKSEESAYPEMGSGYTGANYDADGGYAIEAAAAEEYEYDEVASEDSGTVALQKPEQETDKLIYSGSLDLQTLEYEATRKSIHQKIETAGGFVQWENEYDGNSDWYYSTSRRATRNTEIQARIPSDKFNAFMEDMEGEGQVMRRSVNVENITQTYHETKATVEAYEIERDRLLKMMDKAETIEDMIAVEARLSEVEAELSRYKTSLSSMDRDVAYSTVMISIEEVREYTETVDDSTFFSRLKETAKSSWRVFLGFLEGLVHLFIRLLPFLILGCLLFLLVRVLDKKFGGKRREQRLERKHQRRQQKQWAKQQKQQQKRMRKGQAPPQGPSVPPQNGPVPPQGTPQGPENTTQTGEKHE